MSDTSTSPAPPPIEALSPIEHTVENSTEDAAASPPTMTHGTIRFEDLGEPVQRLLRSIKGDVSAEDMALLEYVSVKDMAKIYSEMATDRHAEEIWDELRAALQARKEKMTKREAELLAKQQALEAEQAAEEERLRQQLEEEEQERIAAEEARAHRREERRRRKAERAAQAAAEMEAAEQAAATAAAEAAAAAEEAAEEAAAAAEEAERQRRAERKRKRREARARELQEERDALAAERAKHEAKKQQKSSNQRKDWSEYVQNHPLEYPQDAAKSDQLPAVIEQKEMKHILNAPPSASEKLLNRTYTPVCPRCGTRFDHPPPEWNCPVCYKSNKVTVKVWQPDNDSNTCMMCKESIGWLWSRHHCRNCGRLVCANCSEKRAIIEDLGYDSPVRVCFDCARLRLK